MTGALNFFRSENGKSIEMSYFLISAGENVLTLKPGPKVSREREIGRDQRYRGIERDRTSNTPSTSGVVE